MLLRRLLGSLRRHPLVRRLAEPVRAAWWRVAGPRGANPPMPAHVDSLLFVCLGNICRSPFAAHLAARLLADAGRTDVRCASAGLRPSQAGRSPEEACRVGAVYGVALDDHLPQPLTRQQIESSDMVIVMEWRQRAELRAAYPEFRDRIFLLPLFDDDARNAYERLNIADPWDRPLAAYEDCYRRIERAVTRCIGKLPR